MTEKEKLEHEIKVLEEAIHLYAQSGGMDTSMAFFLKDKMDELKALETPEIWDGCLGYVGGDIYIYEEVLSESAKIIFTPLPIEVILKHLVGYIKGAVRWEYGGPNYLHLIVEGEHGLEYDFSIPSPYREDWEGIGGEL